MQNVLTQDRAADLRAEMARRRRRLYDIAPAVGMHPNHLGAVLNGRRPLSPELAERIDRAIRGQEDGEHGHASAA
jgi:plasmid maintenance system antidote protein VapI